MIVAVIMRTVFHFKRVAFVALERKRIEEMQRRAILIFGRRARFSKIPSHPADCSPSCRADPATSHAYRCRARRDRVDNTKDSVTMAGGVTLMRIVNVDRAVESGVRRFDLQDIEDSDPRIFSSPRAHLLWTWGCDTFDDFLRRLVIGFLPELRDELFCFARLKRAEMMQHAAILSPRKACVLESSSFCKLSGFAHVPYSLSPRNFLRSVSKEETGRLDVK